MNGMLEGPRAFSRPVRDAKIMKKERKENGMSGGLERTLAVTNLPLLLAALWCAFSIGRTRAEGNRHLKLLWVREFALASAAALLGTAVHGFDLHGLVSDMLWGILFAVLFAIADGMHAAVLLLTEGYSLRNRLVSVVPAALLLGVTMYLHWSGMYSVNMIPFCAYALFAAAVCVFRVFRVGIPKTVGRKAALLAVPAAAAVLSVAFFDGKSFSLGDWPVDGSVMSHVFAIPALLILLGLAKDTLKENDSLEDMLLRDLQPSQFLVSEDKLGDVEKWFRADGMSGFEPIPVRLLDGVPVMTDGHTRAAAALRAGLDRVPLIPEEDELDWEMYRRCVEECRRRGVDSPLDLLDRIVPGREYSEEWDGWCDRMQAEVITGREKDRYGQ